MKRHRVAAEILAPNLTPSDAVATNHTAVARALAEHAKPIVLDASLRACGRVRRDGLVAAASDVDAPPLRRESLSAALLWTPCAQRGVGLDVILSLWTGLLTEGGIFCVVERAHTAPTIAKQSRPGLAATTISSDLLQYGYRDIAQHRLPGGLLASVAWRP